MCFRDISKLCLGSWGLQSTRSTRSAGTALAHPGMTSSATFWSGAAVMVQPPFPFSVHLWLPLTPSASTLPLLPLLCSNSEAYLHNLYNYIVPTLRLTTDQYWTHSDLVPMPRAAIYIPFLHLSYLPDPFSLTITGNYSFLV